MSSESNVNRVTVVIRSAGERTEQVCRNLILEQGVKEDAVLIVRETPFSEALRVGCELGIKAERPWTYFVDADLLLRPGSIGRMIDIADSQAEKVCEIQGFVLDKFFGGVRPGGVHLYRTSLLNQFMKCIPPEGAAIRPETYALNMMMTRGFQWKSVPEVVGLHDFEQAYADIFRKTYVFAHKNLQLASYFVSYWRSKVDEDADFEVALAGLAAGVRNPDEPRIDAKHEFFSTSADWLEHAPKPPLAALTWDLEKVENFIGNWSGPPNYYDVFPVITITRDENLWSRLKSFWDLHRERLGPKRTIGLFFGLMLTRIGQRIQQDTKSK